MFILLDASNVVINADHSNNAPDNYIDIGSTIAIAGQILENAVIESGVLISGDFVDPSLSLDELKDKRKDYINIQRHLAIDSGIEYDGNNYDSTQSSREALAGVYGGINNGYALPVGFSWRTADDITVAFSIVDVNAMSHIMLDHVNTQFAKSWALKALIDAASTVEDIAAVVW